jgi:hypothetical protein
VGPPEVGDVVVVLPGGSDVEVPDRVAGRVVEPPAAAPGPPAGVDPVEVPELPGRAGVVPAGRGVGFGDGGLLDEDDGLGVGVGAGADPPGGGLLGAPPEPKEKPITVPGAGSYSDTPALLYVHEPPRDAWKKAQ